MTKRIFDLLVSGLGLLILWPVFLAVAALIKITDGGPVFYRQERVGRYGRPFRIWKFRSMRVGADRLGPSITSRGDPRITSIGRILRATKLDELPQLLNVFLGEMSMVGPRPEVQKYVDLYDDVQRKILEYRPGITDLASIEFRGEEVLLAAALDREGFYIEYCMPRKLRLNMIYVERSSVCLDVLIIMRTIKAVFWG